MIYRSLILSLFLTQVVFAQETVKQPPKKPEPQRIFGTPAENQAEGERYENDVKEYKRKLKEYETATPEKN